MDAPEIHRLLLAELTRNERELARMEADHAHMVAASESSNADDEHDPEGATIAFEREQLASIIARVRKTALDLRQALADLESGSYGRCRRCGEPIAPGRLEALPHARTCIDCARHAPPAD